MTAQNAQDPILVDSLTVACDGGPGASGHPKVYLDIEPNTNEAVCPYCSRRFKLDENAKAGGH